MAALLPCPFCGAKPHVSSYGTESLWSHEQVTYTRIGCDECDIAFNTEPGHELQAAEAWNRRPLLSSGEQSIGSALVEPEDDGSSRDQSINPPQEEERDAVDVEAIKREAYKRGWSDREKQLAAGSAHEKLNAHFAKALLPTPHGGEEPVAWADALKPFLDMALQFDLDDGEEQLADGDRIVLRGFTRGHFRRLRDAYASARPVRKAEAEIFHQLGKTTAAEGWDWEATQWKGEPAVLIAAPVSMVKAFAEAALSPTSDQLGGAE
jgi:Lar family restriction alleviation protein